MSINKVILLGYAGKHIGMQNANENRQPFRFRSQMRCRPSVIRVSR